MKNNAYLAEMANTADYAAMSYEELVTINFAFILALGEIKPLMKKKRQEEMDAHTRAYVSIMNNYGASKAEILTSLEKEPLRETPYGPLTHQDVDDQTVIVVTEEESKSQEESKLTPLLLPAPKSSDEETSVAKVDSPVDVAVTDEESNTETAISEKETEVSFVEEASLALPEHIEEEAVDEEATFTPALIEKAIEMAENNLLPESVNEDASYYVENGYSLDDNGNLKQGHTTGRNLSSKDLKSFRSAAKKYVKLFLEEDVLVATDKCLVSTRGKNTVYVTLYHFSENANLGADADGDKKILSEEEKAIRRHGRKMMKQAINEAKLLSFPDGTSPETPFYDRYTFQSDCLGVNLNGEQQRFKKEADELTEIMPVVETFARYYGERSLVLKKDNCVAAKYGNKIYLVLFNIPKEKRTYKKSAAANKDNTVSKKPESSPAQGAKDLILKAVDIAKTLAVADSTDTNAPHFVQHSFAITDNGELIYRGRPFSRNVGIGEMDRFRKDHRKFAKTLKANATVSTDDYTAFIWNDGKSLIVFLYNINTASAAA